MCQSCTYSNWLEEQTDRHGTDRHGTETWNRQTWNRQTDRQMKMGTTLLVAVYQLSCSATTGVKKISLHVKINDAATQQVLGWLQSIIPNVQTE